jgi:hypothetical protein
MNRPPRTRSFLGATLALLTCCTPLLAQEVQGEFGRDRSTVQQKLLTPGLTDVWALDVVAGEALCCKVASDAFDPVLTLVDESGKELGRDDGVGTASELWWLAPAKGKLEFRVAPFRGSGGGRYRIELLRFRTEPLSLPGRCEHVFDAEGWWHWRIDAQKGETIVTALAGHGRIVDVLGPDHARVPMDQGVFTAATAGEHWLRVEGANEARCVVHVQRARFGERGVDQPSRERIAPFGLDRWRVRVAAGSCLSVDVQMPEAQLDLGVHEVDSDPRAPRIVRTGHFDKGGAKRGLWYVRRDCELQISLRNRGPHEAPYAMTVRTMGTALPLGEVREAMLPLGDGALLHLDLAAGEMVELQAKSEQFDAVLDVWDPDGNVLAVVDDASPLERDPRHRFVAWRGGRYRVLVHCAEGRGGGLFTVHGKATALPVVKPGGELAIEPGSHAHLDLAAGQVVWLAVEGKGFDPALVVADPLGDQSFVAEGGGIDGGVLVAFRAQHAGRHTLVVHARSGQGGGRLRVLAP